MKTLNEYIDKYYTKEVLFEKEQLVGHNTEKGNLYRCFYKVAENKKVFSIIGYPKSSPNDGGFPAAVLVHGGEGRAFYEWVEEWTSRGYIAIAPDYDGNQLNSFNAQAQENTCCKIKGYGSTKKENLTEEHPWIYFSVLSTIKAVDVLCSEPNVNRNKILIDGISWGGFLTLIVCAKEPRLKCGIINYSSAFISEGSWGKEKMELNKLNEEEISLYDKNFDPRSYLKDIKIPTLFSAGTQDVCFYVRGRKKTTDAIPSKKFFSYRYNFNHGHYEVFAEQVNYRFAAHILSGESYPEISDEGRTNNEIDCKKKTLVFSEEDYTKEDTVCWKEQTYDGEIPVNAKAYFICAEMKDGVKISTDVIEKEK